jgi:hypothetical protein
LKNLCAFVLSAAAPELKIGCKSNQGGKSYPRLVRVFDFLDMDQLRQRTPQIGVFLLQIMPVTGAVVATNACSAAKATLAGLQICG